MKAETRRRKRRGTVFIQIWWRRARSSDRAAEAINDNDIGWKKGRAKLSEQ